MSVSHHPLPHDYTQVWEEWVDLITAGSTTSAHAPSWLTQQGWNSLHTSIVDNCALRRHHLLPQSLGIVHHLKIATGGESPPHWPAEQGAGRVTDQEVVPQDLQHAQPVCLGLLYSKGKPSSNAVVAIVQTAMQARFPSSQEFFSSFVKANCWFHSSKMYVFEKNSRMCYQGLELWSYQEFQSWLHCLQLHDLRQIINYAKFPL